ncbi:MAG: hypothetical protein Q8P92_03590 [Candidatus Daviesbacteria bacterium]|nr:hypothetical protein [Candidatus Daviesbacteria bacterium]
MKLNTLTINIWSFIEKQLLLIAALAVIALLQTTILVSPSHPFVDNNNNGIDDFEESTGEYADPESRAKIYGVTFPIAELGNCANYYDCRTFCEDPVNAQSCINYGKSRGFYKEDEVDSKKEGILEAAKRTLGCDSYETCKNFCEIPTNQEKCDAFAKSQNIVGGHVDDPAKQDILEKAQEVLGCDSYAACATFCSQEANQSQCSEFARQVGLRGGEVQVGPGGCTSRETCKAFCSDPQNYQICSGFSGASGGSFSGPGGCNSEGSCRAYCQEHKNECSSLEGPGGFPPPGYNPQEMCNRTPKCAWKDNTCQCGLYEGSDATQKAEEYTRICRENPSRCTPGGVAGFETAAQRAEFERYCREHPEACRPSYSGFGGSTYDPAKECVKYSGCSWTNNSCQCSTRYETDPAQACQSGGCSWTGNTCDCSKSSGGSVSPSYGSRETQEAGCKAGGGTCDWSSGYCNCRGYTSTGGTSGGGSTPAPTAYPNTTPYSAPSGMTRESQEEGCRSCGGTCNWSGDFCNCQCTTSGSTTSTSSTPQPTTSSTDTQTQTSQEGSSIQDPATACAQTPGCSWNGSSCQCGSTQGVSTNRSFFQIIMDWLGF